MSLITFLVIAIFLVIVLFCVGGVVTYNLEREHQEKCDNFDYKKLIKIGECENYYYDSGIISILGNGELINFGDEEI